jgi:hypothetical protein
MEKKFLTPIEPSGRSGGAIDVGTLANWRTAGKGPPFTKIGKVLYGIDALLKWEESRTVRPGA